MDDMDQFTAFYIRFLFLLFLQSPALTLSSHDVRKATKDYIQRGVPEIGTIPLRGIIMMITRERNYGLTTSPTSTKPPPNDELIFHFILRAKTLLNSALRCSFFNSSTSSIIPMNSTTSPSLPPTYHQTQPYHNSTTA